ncbi:hypothetical protein BTJ26_03105 [Lactobacillus delbrueckii subsp. bulgaricus]|nr:hypothetical protein [Lactobacillus delbrueckii subsp. bulgaricus]MBT9069183.1 hypothetical protein [Lactobacillus delbrueckii subsp. bulgaricus]
MRIETNASQILELTNSRGIAAFKGQKSASSDFQPVLVANQVEGWYYVTDYSRDGYGLPVDCIFNVGSVEKDLKELEKELIKASLYKVDLYRLAQKYSSYDLEKEAKAFAKWAENHIFKGGAFGGFLYWTAGMASPCFSDFWLGDQSQEAAAICQDWQNFQPGFSSVCRWQWKDYDQAENPFSASQQFMIWASWQLVLAAGQHNHIF